MECRMRRIQVLQPKIRPKAHRGTRAQLDRLHRVAPSRGEV